MLTTTQPGIGSAGSHVDGEEEEDLERTWSEPGHGSASRNLVLSALGIQTEREREREREGGEVDIRETAVVFMITARYTVRPFGQWRIPCLTRVRLRLGKVGLKGGRTDR